MTSGAWDYYMTYSLPQDLPQDIETGRGAVVRVRTGDALTEGYVYTRESTWQFTTVLADIKLGMSDKDYISISRDRARELIAQRVAQGRVDRIPDDL